MNNTNLFIMNDLQKKKRNFRASKIWKAFRHKINVMQKGLDYITHKKLLKGANLHHMNLDASKYEDLSNEDQFIFLNKSTHTWVHEIYRYYRTDPEVLDRLKEVLDKMILINEN